MNNVTMGMNVLNTNIKRYREHKGISMQALGDAIGVTKTTIYRYESGQIHNIDTKTIMLIANALDCTPAQLVGWEQFPVTNNDKLNDLCNMCTNLEPDKLQSIIDMVNVMFSSWGYC